MYKILLEFINFIYSLRFVDIIKKTFCFTLITIIFISSITLYEDISVLASEQVVVVIDPGHGGENLGTNYLPVPEKFYNMEVALHMKEQLENYQNIKVYLTHEEDIDMSLQERADFAQSVEADFLISLHFNMSLSHELYGSEVWIPSTGTLYSQGYSMANEFINQFEEMGLFNRGIKTRIGTNNTDYYGIIRHCSVRNIPAIIVEHCHVDNKNDIDNLASDKLKEFGIRNAEAVARYYGLTSKDNDKDYSDYAPVAIPIPAGKVYNDTTSPDIANVSLISCSKSRRYATVTLTAQDYDTNIQYYAYSYDNGFTWSSYFPWQKGKNNMTITVIMPYCKKDSLIFKVTNLYDLVSKSNSIALK